MWSTNKVPLYDLVQDRFVVFKKINNEALWAVPSMFDILNDASFLKRKEHIYVMDTYMLLNVSFAQNCLF